MLWTPAQGASEYRIEISSMCLQNCNISLKRVGIRRWAHTIGPSTASAHSQIRLYSAPVEGSIPFSKQKYVPDSGTYPKGFSVSGTHVGVKASNTRLPDLALIASDRPCSAAAVFTKNKFQAAPVTISRETLQVRNGEGLRAIVINSGCANAVTGKQGLKDAISMASTVDSSISSSPVSSSPSSTLVMSTGVIGQPLPISKILSKIPFAHSTLCHTHASWLAAARAICTTDTFPKLLSTTFTLPSSPGTTYSLAGLAKGAGMIHPNMATLLGIFATDAPVPASSLRPLLTHAVDRSFNSISIDGDTSTNDTVAILANGAAGGAPITSPTSADGRALQEILTSFAQTLSQLVVRDGEGATKFVRVRVTCAKDYDSAKAIASSIARSPLVKTALYGKDANWGRILCAVGYTPVQDAGAVDPDSTSVSFVPVDGSPELRLLVRGEPERWDEERAKKILQGEELEIKVDLGTGEEEANYWFCDFSHEYVTINADYRT
ncbi:MAG: hypothetical protein LQ340_004207 [Diploschistes diacapsis]|nr:MAG: hypothetical protein LQ340_004207 [Diploschistes diacapsis]